MSFSNSLHAASSIGEGEVGSLLAWPVPSAVIAVSGLVIIGFAIEGD